VGISGTWRGATQLIAGVHGKVTILRQSSEPDTLTHTHTLSQGNTTTTCPAKGVQEER